MGVAFIEGAQSEGVIATAKHFAANSIEDTRFDVDVTVGEHALHEVYLPHFRRAVEDAGVGAVMSAYNSVNGLHCDINPPLLTEILREQWGFAGFVMSDWLLGTHGDVQAVTAGLDVEMPAGPNFAMLPGAVAEAVLPAARARMPDAAAGSVVGKGVSQPGSQGSSASSRHGMSRRSHVGDATTPRTGRVASLRPTWEFRTRQ